ncbi:MAG: DUF748 domain-containing protein [Alphaproteobacteria bacterium]
MPGKKVWVVVVAVIALLLITARIYLPYWVTDYVNQEISRLDGYGGGVGEIDLHLWRGAYQIHDINIHKTQGGLKEPFMAAKTVDLSVQWNALFQGAIVAEIDVYKLNLNFAKNQTGEEANWAEFVDTLSPLDINRLAVHSGKIAYIDYTADPNVNIYLDHINAEVTNLKKIEDKDNPLPSNLHVSGHSIGDGKLSIDGKLNLLKNTPDFDITAKLEGASLTAFNDYTRSYASVDFESGTIGIFSELAAANGRVIGYVKPVADNISIIDVKNQDKNPFNLLWESAVAVFVKLFQNHPTDQFAMRIPIEGDINNPDQNIWAAFLSIFENAFGKAFSKDADGNIDFSDIPQQEN